MAKTARFSRASRRHLQRLSWFQRRNRTYELKGRQPRIACISILWCGETVGLFRRCARAKSHNCPCCAVCQYCWRSLCSAHSRFTGCILCRDVSAALAFWFGGRAQAPRSHERVPPAQMRRSVGVSANGAPRHPARNRQAALGTSRSRQRSSGATNSGERVLTHLRPVEDRCD